MVQICEIFHFPEELKANPKYCGWLIQFMTQSFDDVTPNKNGLLDGIKVIEFGHFLAAPITGMMLADQGAEVIHIVDPNASTADPILDAILERGKTQIKLDLKQKDQLDTFKELISRADIVIENYRPGALQKLGIDFNEIRSTVNPRLISCSIPAFNSVDPRGKVPGYEGIPGMAGYLYEKAMKAPIYHTFPAGSILSALYAANSLIAGLIACDRDGVGQHIEVNLYESNLFAQILQLLVLTGAPRSFMPFKMIGTPFMGAFLCKDKRYLYVHVTLPKHNAQILEYFEKNGYEEDIKELRSFLSEGTIQDPSKVANINEANKIREILHKIYGTKDAAEWEKLLGSQFCCIKFRTLEEWVYDSIESGNDDCTKVSDPLFGELYAPGAAAYSPQTPPTIKPRQINNINIEDIIKQWPKKEKLEDIEILNQERKPPLDGMKVLDLARVIAGPFVARILAEFGADVISVQSPKSLDWALSFHVIYNSGKKSMSLDFGSEEGQQNLWKLIETYKPNVFLQNYRNLEFSKEIGLDYDSIQAKLPEIVYAYVNAYGIKGSWQNRPAFEQVVQAVTGVQLEYAQGKKPRIVPFAILDMGAGLLGAYSALLGLYKQQTNKTGGLYHAHMTTVAMLLQTLSFSKFQQPKWEAKKEELTPQLNVDPNLRIYTGIFKTMDRFVCVSGPVGDIQKWFKKANLLRKPNEPFESQLLSVRKRFRTATYSFWQRTLRHSGLSEKIGFIRRYRMTRLLKITKKYNKGRTPIVVKKNYPGLGPLTFLHTPIHFTNTPIVDVNPAPIQGSNTKEVLAMIGKEVPENTGIVPYPTDKPLLEWMWNFMVWGYYALRSGSF